MKTGNALIALRKKIITQGNASSAGENGVQKKKSEQSFQKLNAARVKTLRERGQRLKASVKERLCMSSSSDKLDELISFERGL